MLRHTSDLQNDSLARKPMAAGDYGTTPGRRFSLIVGVGASTYVRLLIKQFLEWVWAETQRWCFEIKHQCRPLPSPSQVGCCVSVASSFHWLHYITVLLGSMLSTIMESESECSFIYSKQSGGTEKRLQQYSLTDPLPPHTVGNAVRNTNCNISTNSKQNNEIQLKQSWPHLIPVIYVGWPVGQRGPIYGYHLVVSSWKHEIQ